MVRALTTTSQSTHSVGMEISDDQSYMVGDLHCYSTQNYCRGVCSSCQDTLSLASWIFPYLLHPVFLLLLLVELRTNKFSNWSWSKHQPNQLQTCQLLHQTLLQTRTAPKPVVLSLRKPARKALNIQWWLENAIYQQKKTFLNLSPSRKRSRFSKPTFPRHTSTTSKSVRTGTRSRCHFRPFSSPVASLNASSSMMAPPYWAARPDGFWSPSLQRTEPRRSPATRTQA